MPRSPERMTCGVLADDPQPPRPGHPRAGASDVQAVGDHLIADPEMLGSVRNRYPLPGNRERGILCEQKRPGQPLRLVLWSASTRTRALACR